MKYKIIKQNSNTFLIKDSKETIAILNSFKAVKSYIKIL